MENTSATLHQESAYQNARQLVDKIAGKMLFRMNYFISGLVTSLQLKAGAISH
jgi:hypothetical protein